MWSTPNDGPLIQFFSFILYWTGYGINWFINIDIGGMTLGSLITIAIAMALLFKLLEGKGESNE